MPGPVCLIVGMGPGISLAVAKRFGREGYTIAMVARRPDALDAAQQELLPEGIQARAYAADAGDEASLRDALARIRSECGDPDVVVYNASRGTPGPPTSLSRHALIRDFDVNVTGAVVTAQECAGAMAKVGRGTILLTGGGLAFEPMAEIASLSLGKAAIRSLALSLAGELAPKGIHVATVTVCGFVQPGTKFAPELIAEEYWRLHQQEQPEWQREVVFQ